MASKKGAVAAAALAGNLGRLAQKRIIDVFESRLKEFSAWHLAAVASFSHCGYLALASPWSFHRESREQQLFPWSLQDLHNNKQFLLFSNAQPKLDSSLDIDDDRGMNVAETRKIVTHVNVVALKERLKLDPRDSLSYRALLDLIKESNVVANDEEAMRCARALDEAGVVLIFRENVYLHPRRIAKLVASALPFAVVPLDDPRRNELMKLDREKANIDVLAHKHVRRYLWTGLGVLTCQAALFFRLTFWELSWDIMEPIAFFVTSAGLIGGYTYFLVTSRDPSYQDLRQRLFHKQQVKLFKKMNFDNARYQLLRRQCQCVDPDDRR